MISFLRETEIVMPTAVIGMRQPHLLVLVAVIEGNLGLVGWQSTEMKLWMASRNFDVSSGRERIHGGLQSRWCLVLCR
jgi:hypothetical protein